MVKNSKITNNIFDKLLVYLKNPLVLISILFLISVIILIIISKKTEKYFCDLKTHDYIPAYGCLPKCSNNKYTRCGKICYDPSEQKCLEPDKVCNICDGECCSGSCLKNPINPEKNICCLPNKLCVKDGIVKCCGNGLVCVDGNCVPKCAPFDQTTTITETISDSSFNLEDGTITDGNNQFVDKMKVNFTSNSQLPKPIVPNAPYYIKRIDNTKIKIATSLSDIDAGNFVKFTDTGSVGSQITISSVIIDRVCSTGEECYHMSNILKNSGTYKTIKSEMKTNPKIKEYTGIDNNHSDFYTCKVKPNCSYLDAPFAAPPAIDNKYPSFNLQIPNGNTEFCSIKNANQSSSEDIAKNCFNKYTSEYSCNNDDNCQWYDLMKTNKTNVGTVNQAILKITQENDGLYCGKEGQRIFGKTEQTNSQCSPTDCFIGIANSQTRQINYDADTKTCVALLDSKKIVDSPILGNYQLMANNNQLQTIDLSNNDTQTSEKLSGIEVDNYPYMPDCSETDKINQLCSSFTSEICQKDSGTLISPSNYCGPDSTYTDGKCICKNNGTLWNKNTYDQGPGAVPGCTTSLCYAKGGQTCNKDPSGYCSNVSGFIGKACSYIDYGKTGKYVCSFLGNQNLNTDNPDCTCNPAYKGKICDTLVRMTDLFTSNNIIPRELAVEMEDSGIPINEGVFVLPGPGVEILDDISIKAGYLVDLEETSGRPAIKDFLQTKWPAKWGCGQGYLFMNRDIFNHDINLYITGKNIYTGKTSFNHSYSNGNYRKTECSPYTPDSCDNKYYHRFYIPEDQRGGDGYTYGGNIVFFNSDPDDYKVASVIIIGAT